MNATTTKAYQAWQRAVDASMRRAMRTGAEHITDATRRWDRIARLKAKFEALLIAEKVGQ